MAFEHFHKGDTNQAESLLRNILSLDPDQADACNLLGIILAMRGDFDAGRRQIRHAIELNPRMASYHLNLGLACYKAGDIPQALEAFRQAVHLDPHNADACNNLGAALWQSGQVNDALEAYRMAVRLQPGLVEAQHNIASILTGLGRHEEAVEACRTAIARAPAFAMAHNTLATILWRLGRLAEAEEAACRAVGIRADFAEAHNTLGIVLRAQGRIRDAMQCCKEALRINPRIPGARSALAYMLMETGYPDQAEEGFRQAMALAPDNANIHGNLIFLLSAGDRDSAVKAFEECRRWDERHGAAGRRHIYPNRNQHESRSDRIRIGYVSPDFRRHPVSQFFEPIISHHDHERFEIFCYDVNDKGRDDTTTRIRSCADHWRQVADKSPAGLAAVIREDHIDILVDLAGHTSGNRLQAFTYRPAPVQATYLGFFAATGLEAMDYWITDSVTHPAGTLETTMEEICRLSRCSLCYRPPEWAPDVSPPPGDDARVTFGSFNQLVKITPDVIEAWSAVLSRMPESRMMITARHLDDEHARARILELFSRHGISEDRLVLQAAPGTEQWFGTYADVDVVLDTFPRTGTTTTAEALWMGLPVVTLAGERYAGRASATILEAVGLGSLVTDDVGAYIDKACSVAQDADWRSDLRAGLRARMLQSDLCDAEGLARAMEEAYRNMWARYLEGNPGPRREA